MTTTEQCTPAQPIESGTSADWADVARTRHAHYSKLLAEKPAGDISLTVQERILTDLVPHLVAAIDLLGKQLAAFVSTSTRVEWGASCHMAGSPDDVTSMVGNQFVSRNEAARWGVEQVGQYGIVRYTIWRREHYTMPDGCPFVSASGPWVRDTGETPTGSEAAP